MATAKQSNKPQPSSALQKAVRVIELIGVVIACFFGFFLLVYLGFSMAGESAVWPAIVTAFALEPLTALQPLFGWAGIAIAVLLVIISGLSWTIRELNPEKWRSLALAATIVATAYPFMAVHSDEPKTVHVPVITADKAVALIQACQLEVAQRDSRDLPIPVGFEGTPPAGDRAVLLIRKSPPQPSDRFAITADDAWWPIVAAGLKASGKCRPTLSDSYASVALPLSYAATTQAATEITACRIHSLQVQPLREKVAEYIDHGLVAGPTSEIIQDSSGGMRIGSKATLADLTASIRLAGTTCSGGLSGYYAGSFSSGDDLFYSSRNKQVMEDRL